MGIATAARKGFTIVELLIVIVVIAILAAITIVAFNGIQERARASALQSDVSQALKKIEAYRVSSGTDQYPPDLATVGVVGSNGATLSYNLMGSSAKEYCVASSIGTVSYFSVNGRPPQLGGCQIAAWSLASTADSGGGGYTLTPMNGPVLTTGQGGQANTAYSFNGTSQYFDAAGVGAALVGTNTMTLSGWVNPAANTTAHRGYFGIRNDGANSFYVLQLNGGYNLECRLRVGGVTYDSSGLTVVPNTWQHIAFVYDGTSVRCYRNGAGATQTAVPGGASVTTAETFRIGMNNSFYMNGSIDDVRVYRYAMSATEVQQLFSTGAQ